VPRAQISDYYGHAVRPTPKGAKVFEAADPFEYSRLYENEKYNLNNMVLAQANFPHDYYPDDTLYSIWSDRITREWCACSHLLGKSKFSGGDAFLAGVSSKNLIAFASKLFALLRTENNAKFLATARELLSKNDNVKVSEDLAYRAAAEEIVPFELTGVAIVRFTNMGGYPTLRVTGINATKHRGRRMGHPLTEPKPMRFGCDGVIEREF
jgi:hypothetical protein